MTTKTKDKCPNDDCISYGACGHHLNNACLVPSDDDNELKERLIADLRVGRYPVVTNPNDPAEIWANDWAAELFKIASNPTSPHVGVPRKQLLILLESFSILHDARAQVMLGDFDPKLRKRVERIYGR